MRALVGLTAATRSSRHSKPPCALRLNADTGAHRQSYHHHRHECRHFADTRDSVLGLAKLLGTRHSVVQPNFPKAWHMLRNQKATRGRRRNPMTKRLHTLVELGTSVAHTLDCTAALVYTSATARPADICEGRSCKQRLRLADRNQFHRAPGIPRHTTSCLLLPSATRKLEDRRGTSACRCLREISTSRFAKTSASDIQDRHL
jgi:hypothetical protein